jgi:hypothetical protein
MRARALFLCVQLQSGHICMYNVALGEHGVQLHADSSLMGIGCAANLGTRARTVTTYLYALATYDLTCVLVC